MKLCKLICLSIIFFSACLSADDILSNKTIKMKNYTLRELHEDGSLAWIIFGRTGYISGDQLVLQSARVEYYPKGSKGQDKFIIFSPKFIYNKKTRMGRSNEKVQIRSNNMIITGIGCDIDMNKKEITIRKNVKTIFFRDNRNLNGKK